MDKKKEFEKLIDEVMKKKTKMSGRNFVKLIFLSGWDTGRREIKKEIENLREALSNLEHQQWMSWTKYLNANHKIPIELLRKWEKNWKPYSELDEKTKDSDRIWADKVIKKILKELKLEDKTEP